MICIYCLRGEAMDGRRCYDCYVYLDQLARSDEQQDREYAGQLINLAHRYQTMRAVGGYGDQRRAA